MIFLLLLIKLYREALIILRMVTIHIDHDFLFWVIEVNQDGISHLDQRSPTLQLIVIKVVHGGLLIHGVPN